MKKSIYLWLLIWPLLNNAQESCLPQYGLAVQQMSINGSRLAYVETGSGKTLLLVHGLGGNISHWSNNILPLSDSLHVIAIDLPGYGYSDKRIDTTNEDLLGFYADVILRFIEEKGLKEVTIAGHSMGGQIAIITALKNPEKVTQLVLAAPAGLETFTQPEAQLLKTYSVPSLYQNWDEAAIRASFKRNFYAAAPEKLIMERLKFKTCPDFSLYALAISKGVQGMLFHPVKNGLQNLRQKVLIIYGKEDALIPNRSLHPTLTLEEVVKTGTDHIPHSSALFITHAGHMVQYEQPAAFNSAIRSFIHNP